MLIELTATIVKTDDAVKREMIIFTVGTQEFCVDILSVRAVCGWRPAVPLLHAPSFVCGLVKLGHSLSHYRCRYVPGPAADKTGELNKEDKTKINGRSRGIVLIPSSVLQCPRVFEDLRRAIGRRLYLKLVTILCVS
jgi:hypothetical protein